jgi:hypothetical protein
MRFHMNRRLRRFALLSIAAAAGCTPDGPVRQAQPVSTQEMVLRTPLDEVYRLLYARMNNCRTVHNLLFPGDVVGGIDRDGAHGRLFVAKNGRTLWGATLERVVEGTKLVTLIGPDASSDRYHAVMRGWAENRQPPVGYPEC